MICVNENLPIFICIFVYYNICILCLKFGALYRKYAYLKMYPFILVLYCIFHFYSKVYPYFLFSSLCFHSIVLELGLHFFFFVTLLKVCSSSYIYQFYVFFSNHLVFSLQIDLYFFLKFVS